MVVLRVRFGRKQPRFSSGTGALSAGARRKLALPRQRVGDDGGEVIETRLPFERSPDALGGRNDPNRVARPPVRELDLEVDARDALHRLDNLEHGETVASRN